MQSHICLVLLSMFGSINVKRHPLYHDTWLACQWVLKAQNFLTIIFDYNKQQQTNKRSFTPSALLANAVVVFVEIYDKMTTILFKILLNYVKKQKYLEVDDFDAIAIAMLNFTKCPFRSCLLVACNIFLQHTSLRRGVKKKPINYTHTGKCKKITKGTGQNINIHFSLRQWNVK